MARLVRGCPMPQSQQKGTEGPKTNPCVPQQEKQPNATAGKDIVDYDPEVDYEGSESKNEPVIQ